MKTKISMIFAAAVLIVLLLSSCEKNDMGKGPDPLLRNDADLSSFVEQPLGCGTDIKADLFAGKATKVGYVSVTKNPDGTLKVTYQLLANCFMTETHLSVTPTLKAVPQTKSGNPQVGLFNYSTVHNPPVNYFVYDNIPAGSYYILAHAVIQGVVYKVNLPALDESLPTDAKITVKYPYEGGPSYFTTTVTDGGVLNGTYEGWCVDLDNYIYEHTIYSVKVYSSYNPAVSTLGLVEHPENLDKVNWILNQHFVGKSSMSVSGTVFTYGDVQKAIWALIEDQTSLNGIGSWSQTRVDEILAAAAQYGEGFIPDCGDLVAILLKPYNPAANVQLTVAQVTIINYELVCVPSYSDPETAWAAGRDFGGNSWAKYFYFCDK